MIGGVVNFRDFGGLESRLGGQVARDRLYRSGNLKRAQGEALERLLGLDFGLIADLRYAGEREEDPSPWPIAYAERVFCHDGSRAAEAPHLAPLRDGSLDEAMSEQIYLRFYRDIPFDPLYQPLFGRILTALPDLDGRALIHCSAGKDRTGAVVALIHSALGVPRDAIVADYMRSNGAPGFAELVESTTAKMQTAFGVSIRRALIEKLMDVEESYLAAFLDEIEQRCGSVDAYLDQLGLDAPRRELLRERFLT